MDAVGVHAVMGNLPKLGLIRGKGFGGGINETVGNGRLDQGGGKGQFDPQGGIHPTIGIKKLLDGLRLQERSRWRCWP